VSTLWPSTQTLAGLASRWRAPSGMFPLRHGEHGQVPDIPAGGRVLGIPARHTNREAGKMIITLTLVVAGLSSQHQVSSVLYSHDQMIYIESNRRIICTGHETFTFSGTTVRMTADKCTGQEEIFYNGFEL
jgi:hypothetical protein